LRFFSLCRFARFAAQPVEDAMDVATWLRGLGLERHEAAFRDNLIDMDVVPELTENDLEKLGLALGDRKRILKAIPRLPALQPATATVARRARDEAERRPVTVMFCDLVGSTSLAVALDAEDWRDLVQAYLDDAAAAVARYGGHCRFPSRTDPGFPLRTDPA
jgi:hypothetical protein